jgi:hypothetical protein
LGQRKGAKSNKKRGVNGPALVKQSPNDFLEALAVGSVKGWRVVDGLGELLWLSINRLGPSMRGVLGWSGRRYGKALKALFDLAGH